MKLNCELVAVCLPDYWSGHHLPHVQIPVFAGMTMAQVKDAIRYELTFGAVAGSDDDARILSDHYVGPENEKRADRLTRAAFAAVNRMRPAKKGARKLFNDLDEQSEDCESVYAFFVFVEA